MSALTQAASVRYKTWKQYTLTVTTSETVFTPLTVPDTSGLVGRLEAIFVQGHPANSTAIVYIGKTGVLGDGSNGGYAVGASSNLTIPTNKISELFAISSSGTIKLLVTYLADPI